MWRILNNIWAISHRTCKKSNSGTLDPFLKNFESTVGSGGWISNTMYYIKLSLVIGLVIFVIIQIAIRLGPVLKLSQITHRCSKDVFGDVFWSGWNDAGKRPFLAI